MRRLTALIADTFVRRDLPPPRRPQPVAVVVRERLNRALRRRLSDRVMDVFHEACMTSDLDTAEELLAVLEAMHDRRQKAAGERRIGDEDVVRAREDLAARKAARRAAADTASNTA